MFGGGRVDVRPEGLGASHARKSSMIIATKKPIDPTSSKIAQIAGLFGCGGADRA